MVRVSLAQTGQWIDRLGRVDGLSVVNPEKKTSGIYWRRTRRPGVTYCM